MSASSRSDALRRQGRLDSGFAVAIAATLVLGGASAATGVLVGLVAIWLALRGRRLTEHAVPLAEDERRELERLRGESRHVREMLELLSRAGHPPLRYDLVRCRQLARVEALLRGA